jgi:hypothetical protein
VKVEERLVDGGEGGRECSRFDFQHQNKNTEKVKETEKENLK